MAVFLPPPTVEGQRVVEPAELDAVVALAGGDAVEVGCAERAREDPVVPVARLDVVALGVQRVEAVVAEVLGSRALDLVLTGAGRRSCPPRRPARPRRSRCSGWRRRCRRPGRRRPRCRRRRPPGRRGRRRLRPSTRCPPWATITSGPDVPIEVRRRHPVRRSRPARDRSRPRVPSTGAARSPLPAARRRPQRRRVGRVAPRTRGTWFVPRIISQLRSQLLVVSARQRSLPPRPLATSRPRPPTRRSSPAEPISRSRPPPPQIRAASPSTDGWCWARRHLAPGRHSRTTSRSSMPLAKIRAEQSQAPRSTSRRPAARSPHPSPHSSARSRPRPPITRLPVVGRTSLHCDIHGIVTGSHVGAARPRASTFTSSVSSAAEPLEGDRASAVRLVVLLGPGRPRSRRPGRVPCDDHVAFGVDDVVARTGVASP